MLAGTVLMILAINYYADGEAATVYLVCLVDVPVVSKAFRMGMKSGASMTGRSKDLYPISCHLHGLRRRVEAEGVVGNIIWDCEVFVLWQGVCPMLALLAGFDL